ncbi:type IV pilin [uncultured Methanobrevibacter sp.]|uniref:type IV pilin n=1 Tax=uncultured Methanobrevibacter sp. TaxID=253161 RepID=UPI00262D1652|nr:type IV pilin [uncultured Methanobrevibacter sp.]
MNNKLLVLVCVVVVILAGVVSAFVFLNSQEESSLTITSNATLYDVDNCTVKLSDEKGIGIANKTINITLTNENGSKTNLKYVTNETGLISFNISDVGNYSVVCIFDGDGEYKSANITQNVSVISKIVQVENNGFKNTNQKSSSQSNYYEDDHLSCEQLKAKYPEMSDDELFERFGERGDNGIMYNGKHVWEDRGDGMSYGGHPI